MDSTSQTNPPDPPVPIDPGAMSPAEVHALGDAIIDAVAADFEASGLIKDKVVSRDVLVLIEDEVLRRMKAVVTPDHVHEYMGKVWQHDLDTGRKSLGDVVAAIEALDAKREP